MLIYTKLAAPRSGPGGDTPIVQYRPSLTLREREQCPFVSDTSSPSALSWLGAAAARLLTCRDEDELVSVVDDEARRGLGVDRVGLALTDESRGVWAWVLNCDESGRPFRDPARRHYPLASFAVAINLDRFADGRAVTYTPDLRAIATPAQRAHLDGPTGENIAAALRLDGRIVGLLSVDNLPSGRPLAPALAEPLAVFAGVLAQTVVTLRGRRVESEARAKAEALTRALAFSQRALQIHKGLFDAREARYRRIVETVQEGIWQIDADGVTTYVNGRLAEMLGYSVDELLGASPLDFKDDDERAPGDAAVRAAPGAGWPERIQISAQGWRGRLGAVVVHTAFRRAGAVRRRPLGDGRYHRAQAGRGEAAPGQSRPRGRQRLYARDGARRRRGRVGAAGL